MSERDVARLRRAWDALARGDLDTATEALHPQVRWYGVDDDDPAAGCQSRDDALAFIRRTLADGVTAEAFDVREAGDRVVVLVRVRQLREWGEPPEPDGEVVTVRDGAVVEMVVCPTVDAAFVAAGLAVG